MQHGHRQRAARMPFVIHGLLEVGRLVLGSFFKIKGLSGSKHPDAGRSDPTNYTENVSSKALGYKVG